MKKNEKKYSVSNFFKAIFTDWWFPEMDRQFLSKIVVYEVRKWPKFWSYCFNLMDLRMFIYIEGIRLQNLPLWMIFSNENVNKPTQLHNVKPVWPEFWPLSYLAKDDFQQKLAIHFWKYAVRKNFDEKFDIEYFFRFCIILNSFMKI